MLEASLIEGSPNPGNGTEWPYVAGRKATMRQEIIGRRRPADCRPVKKHGIVVAEIWLIRLILI